MNIDLFNLPVYTGLVTSFLLVIQIVLMVRVIMERGQSEVLVGTGGVDALEQRIRVHANFLENVPTFLIALALIEILSGSNWWVAGLGLAFVLGRLAHAIGFSFNVGVSAGRLVGTLLSMLSTLIAAGYLAFQAFSQL